MSDSYSTSTGTVMSEHWYVKEVDGSKGFGLFVSHEIKSGTTIFEENPIACSQFSWNKLYKYQSCDYCMKSLESAENMCRRLAQNDCLTLPFPECCPSTSLQPISCPNCETLYCSRECCQAAFNEYHQVLCPARCLCNQEALKQLDETWRSFHYPPETATIMLLVKIIARIKQESDKSEFKQTIEQFCHRVHSTSEYGELAHKLLGDQFEEQLNVLREQLKQFWFEESVSDWYTVEGFQTLFALMGSNQQGIGTSSFSVWVRNCDELPLGDIERGHLDKLIDDLYQELDSVAGIFLNCEGAGLYVKQSKCNHSCVPNAEVAFLHNNHRLTLKAVRDIAENEEITISYLSECELARSRHSRQKFLKENYLFVCKCEKCVQQSGDPDETSSEEESYSENDME